MSEESDIELLNEFVYSTKNFPVEPLLKTRTEIGICVEGEELTV